MGLLEVGEELAVEGGDISEGGVMVMVAALFVKASCSYSERLFFISCWNGIS